MKLNPLHLIDWYKADHRRQYPEGTTKVFSNFTPRKSRIEGVNHMVFFGLQYYILEYLIKTWNENFFYKPIDDVLKQFNRRKNTSLGPNNIGDRHIANLHDLGHIPIKIMALPEGSIVPIKVPPLVLWNTHDDFSWMVNYLETSLSSVIWGSCTAATIAREYRKIFDMYGKLTVGNTDFSPFQGHDFSFRGMLGIEAAYLTGAGHLLSFKGTDTIPAIDFLEEYYCADADEEMIGCSVPATEHAVMCMGMKDGEQETFRRLIQDIYPNGIISIVSDTWDLWEVLSTYLPNLKATVMEREGKVVIRPDSGDPVDIICGKSFTRDGTYVGTGDMRLESIDSTLQYKGVVEALWDIFGGTTSDQGYKVLDPHIGTIYGDSITLQRAKEICHRLEAKKFASTNWVAGIGSYTYQYNTRDTLGMAMKATYGEVRKISRPDTGNPFGVIEPRNIFKDPVTDSGEKKSAKGLIAVYKGELDYYIADEASWSQVLNCAYEPVFENSAILRKHTLSEIRARLANS